MISIVTGTLNRLDLLKLVIDNTVNQSDKIELVLVDGGSIDGTIEYIKNLNHPNILFIEVGHRSSYPHFMNLGIKRSKYDWICQWNDDVLLVNKWDDVFNLLEKNEKDVYIFDWTIGSYDDYLNHKENMDPSKFGCTWVGFSNCVNFGIYNKKVFKEIGMYDNKYDYYSCDGDMTLRCLEFNYKVENSKNIKVFEIKTEKRSIAKSNDLTMYENLHLYKNKQLPKTVEILN